ncbi:MULTISPECIES: YlmH/Sll1252 family protein [Fusobacterium]|uniref:YlmH/Sll1252 family protein n=1 Tax=Fusobacterium TaxID=848 RepID=UPI001F3AB7CB|nr:MULTISPECIES: YlmH/Sll1252 family protein [Fusobacterium]MCF2611836.1 RNA-binding protein [Fusobacterium perfoetens]MDY2980704.1 YlmH/Sll1252 family protein [Fusobacterium sp.]
MDKKGFLNLFKNDDEQIIVKLWEDIELAQNIDYFIETDMFYPPNIWNILEKININGMKFLMCGLTENSEKKNIIIFPKDFQGEMPEFQLTFFKIDGTNRFKELEHKDFLGTIMSLGIKREILGDLIVKENIAYGVILKEKFEIIENLEKVSNIPVKISEISKDEVPQSEFKELLITVPSIRLDSVVGEITNNSRQKSVSLIDEGFVMVNYNIQKSKSLELKEKDIITIRKVGKFIFENIVGENKKGKIKILIKMFK